MADQRCVNHPDGTRWCEESPGGPMRRVTFGSPHATAGGISDIMAQGAAAGERLLGAASEPIAETASAARWASVAFTVAAVAVIVIVLAALAFYFGAPVMSVIRGATG